jgi:hypothetical protein
MESEMIEIYLCELELPATCEYQIITKPELYLCKGNSLSSEIKECPYRFRAIIEKMEVTKKGSINNYKI